MTQHFNNFGDPCPGPENQGGASDLSYAEDENRRLRRKIAELRARELASTLNAPKREQRLRDALRNCVLAMKRSAEEGSTDHLDCCEDGGVFWYQAIEDAEELLKG